MPKAPVRIAIVRHKLLEYEANVLSQALEIPIITNIRKEIKENPHIKHLISLGARIPNVPNRLFNYTNEYATLTFRDRSTLGGGMLNHVPTTYEISTAKDLLNSETWEVYYQNIPNNKTIFKNYKEILNKFEDVEEPDSLPAHSRYFKFLPRDIRRRYRFYWLKVRGMPVRLFINALLQDGTFSANGVKIPDSVTYRAAEMVNRTPSNYPFGFIDVIRTKKNDIFTIDIGVVPRFDNKEVEQFYIEYLYKDMTLRINTARQNGDYDA